MAKSVISAVLIREQDSRQLPIYYVSKVLQGTELQYLNTKKFTFAHLIATRKLRATHQLAAQTDIAQAQSIQTVGDMVLARLIPSLAE
ncbi:hypothetical protein RJ639_033264 [Escallonia herrerae]|uniref:Reverse transcriptase RNase H-like domain-containing protein n=1 Tax=Escallonia herrerae TaxID=1293975 RepID=A0AA88WVN4_9ASTE|nr:hypothetical protein RJ639_033264 [Escallonia herrerae]